MAVNRMDAGKGDADRGDKRPEPALGSEAPKAPAGSAFQAWLPLIVAVVLLPVVAYGVTTFILLPKLQKGLALPSPASAPAAPAASGHGETPPASQEPVAGGKVQVPLSKLIVNVSGTMGSRFLMVTLIMVSTTADFAAVVKEHEAQLKDTAGTILGTKTIPDLEKPGARNIIRSELITAFNHALGGVLVQEIYFTDFAIQ
jgi:flagellar FliL protein